LREEIALAGRRPVDQPAMPDQKTVQAGQIASLIQQGRTHQLRERQIDEIAAGRELDRKNCPISRIACAEEPDTKILPAGPNIESESLIVKLSAHGKDVGLGVINSAEQAHIPESRRLRREPRLP